MKNNVDYSKYECPFAYIERDCGHRLFKSIGTVFVWCACGFRGPAFVLDPDKLGLTLRKAAPLESLKISDFAGIYLPDRDCDVKIYVASNSVYVAFKKLEEWVGLVRTYLDSKKD